MATKSKVNGLNNMHTAGIFSDMTVDGPDIGTLVVIVDRAKNLPNRKTIGKQDPYCAARLGKEAKKTETDRRGGQTPRWDQELRFTVSVFNDDKKTDLIGECWINLSEVVVPGGGQNDLWHNLNCRGKYAGEIRIEITYYDTRPKQDRPEKIKQAGTNGVEDGARDSLKGPRQPKAAPVKRRPLPSDPVTGAPAPMAIPDHVQTPPRGYQSPTGTPDYAQRGYQSSGTPDYVQTPPRGQPPTAIPDHVQTPPRGHQSPSYIPNQSPLQSVEYSMPPSQFMGRDNSPSMKGFISTTTASQPVQHERHEIYDPTAVMNNHMATNSNGRGYYEEEEGIDLRDAYDPRHTPYELPQPEDFGSPPSPGGPPPPPPAHRSRHGSSQASPAPIMTSHGSYGYPTDRRPSNPYDTPPNEFHRHSMPTHSPNNSYNSYGSPGGHDDQFRRSGNGSFQQSPPRQSSYDSRSNDYGSMQPTVEDAPPSPSAHYSGQRGSGSRSSQQDERRYDQVPSPAPLNLSGRGSTVSSRNHSNRGSNQQYANSSNGYTTSNSELSYRDQSYGGSSVSSRTAYSPMPQQNQYPRKQSNDQIADDYGLPPVPATLVAGMDPMIAQEISERIYDEKRASYSQQNGSARGRRDSALYQQSRPHPLSYHEAATPFVPAAASYDERQSRHVTATAPAVKPRGVSPDPRVPARKSVSPAPPSAEGRRLSGIPFGPDSYNALNPTISTSVSTPSLSSRYDPKEADVDAKIITHDGREIDPSDHIPESNYAPLLESKGPKYASQLPDRNYRPAPSGPQPLSASGRRPLKVAPRPHSMSTGTVPLYGNGSPDPTTPTGRNRLQKKTARMSAQPAPHSSPLAPITPYQNNSHSPRSLPRANTVDFNAHENYAPTQGYRGAAGPPLPAKVPMGMGSAPPPPQPAGGDAWALLEEMKNIDLGGGRSRRRGY
ncbi:Ingression protein fic1 [Lachnellula suecica]|uniref:Ingression protein fic1 n=1 Tax=Lachnellula suecica TaxID=602035 RepID=A0A8T9C379_9HELO|nr:Ingression protein fic1 [Lachnellula suecica]